MNDQTAASALPPLSVPEHVRQHVLRAYAAAGLGVVAAYQEWTGTTITDEAETGRLLDRYKPAVDALAEALLGEVSGEVAAVVARLQAPVPVAGSEQP